MNVDVDVWLSAKLEEAWSSERVASQLSVPILQQARARFALLDTPIKLRLLFAFASLRRNRKLWEELESEMRQLLTLGGEDDDEWVRVMSKMLGVLLKDEASDTSAAHDHLEALALALNNEHFTDLIDQVRQRLEERKQTPAFFPLEFPYLNKELVPEQPTTTEPHFRLKKPLEEPAPLTLTKRLGTKSVTMKGGSTPDLSEKGGLNKSGPISLSKSLGGSSPSLRTSTAGAADRGLKRSLTASRGSLGGLASSQKKLRVLEINEVIGMEQNQEHEKLKKKREDEELEKERRRKEKQDAAEAKRLEREEKKKKKLEEIEKRKAKKEEEKAEKEAKRKERLAAQAQVKAQRRAAAAAAALSKKTAVSSPEPMSPTTETSPTIESPTSTPTQSPYLPSQPTPSAATPSQRTPQVSASPSLPFVTMPAATPASLGPLGSAGGIGVTVGGGMGALGSGGITTAPSSHYSSSLSSALQSGAPSTGLKPYPFGTLGGSTPTSSGLGVTPSYLSGARPTGQGASSLLSQALLPQTQGPPFGGQQTQSSLLSAFSASRPSMHQQSTQAPSSLLSAYMSTQPQSNPYSLSNSFGHGTTSVPSYPPSLHQPPPTQPSGVPGNLFDQANMLSDNDRAMLIAFLKGESNTQMPNQGIRQILLNEEEKVGEGGMRYLEQIIFEINYQNGSWRKLRRKKVIPTAPPTDTAQAKPQ